MPKFNTLSTRFILLFCAITVPLLSILYLAGNFTKGVVLTQVANSYQNLVSAPQRQHLWRPRPSRAWQLARRRTKQKNL
ncbi:hypothetical protein [Paenibacillus sp. OV219]|uniref:hypothetical protein n=1 Tax=Paenibacillus sp. OV219 TaxID=1884377 RepID=UPI0008C1762E|nr:hypothetical protein [Paenibacillus sp. OV219]SEO53943.1 hypothetical protein SAMN05518847_108203 [Paenibacillus sp. OV219]